MTSAFRQTTASRGIPAMRPSYDAEHPHSATPIYDELYSEYRRLFRALPGDRAGEEDLRFTGFAVRERRPHGYASAYAVEEYRSPYTHGQPHPGHAPGPHGYGHGHGPEQPSTPPQHQSFPTYAGYVPGVPQFVPAQQQVPQQHPHHQAQAQAQGQPATPHPGAPSAGQGWVASGYLAATVPAAPAPPSPAPVGASVAGRHRSGLLSLPPGRTPTLS
ncbi:hypothetical protein P3T37_003511 [Kitasatospora sp. MAA4]|uniref:hypothetical protein n=1 Tax=Kitasatospora sp. MAA4 TaxID=3035093 RepID=UPI002476EEDF|nr:hypothetical protein [Kitasatospora sp. MAA4]MDH6134109.1 hypothetical protein [Kitasatospora sp. MAA4]